MCLVVCSLPSRQNNRWKPSDTKAFKTGQSHVTPAVTLLFSNRSPRYYCIFGLVGPHQFDIACCVAILLGLLELQDINSIDSSPGPGICERMFLDAFMYLLLVVLPGFGALNRTGHPFKLTRVHDSEDCQLVGIRSVEIIVYYPDLLRVMDAEVHGGMHSKCTTETPIIGLDSLFQICTNDSDDDVLIPAVFRVIQQ